MSNCSHQSCLMIGCETTLCTQFSWKSSTWPTNIILNWKYLNIRPSSWQPTFMEKSELSGYFCLRLQRVNRTRLEICGLETETRVCLVRADLSGPFIGDRSQSFLSWVRQLKTPSQIRSGDYTVFSYRVLHGQKSWLSQFFKFSSNCPTLLSKFIFWL